MLTEICNYLKNWFDRKPNGEDFPKYEGKFQISGCDIVTEVGQVVEIQQEQYFRIIGSVFNDGVHKYPDVLKDELFEGEVWLMGVPVDVQEIASEVAEWQTKFGATDSVAMSPFSSESFGGYSYSKGSGRAGSNQTVSVTWIDVFSARLARYKKI